MAIELQLKLMGTFMVTLNEKPITNFRTVKISALLTYLVLEAGRFHLRQALAVLLWPDMPSELALKNLRLALYRLRKNLDAYVPEASQQLLTVTRQGMQLDETKVVTDVGKFLALIENCENHPHHHITQCAACTERLVQASNLYQGELLAGFSAGSTEIYDAWLQLWREKLEQQLLNVLQLLATTYEQQGDIKKVEEYSTRLLAIDPFHEAGYRQLMRVWAANGRHSEAFTLYEKYRQLFLVQLGVGPSSKSRALYEQLRQEQLAHRHTTAPNKLQESLLHHFPTQFTPFYGREVELEQLKKMLLADERRLITVIGPGGVGKTRLAGQAAGLVAEKDHFTDGIYFFSLLAVESENQFLMALIAGLGLTIHEQTDPHSYLFAFLRDKCCLLVLDNFEQLTAVAPFLVKLLANAPQLKLLVTSRFALNLRAEWRLQLHGLAYPQADIQNDDALDYSSVQLFVESARHVAPAFKLTPQNETAIAQICQLVQGLPLALEIAGAWTRLMNEDDIAAEIQRSLDFLETPLQDMPTRHRSMTAVFSYSWNLLTPLEQKTLAQLSVFQGAFSLQTAVAITEAPFSTFAKLMDCSLLQRPVNGRYEMHELIRQFAAQKLTTITGGEQIAQQTQNRHSDYYLAYIADAQSDLHGPQPHLTVNALQPRVQNIYKAWLWALSQQRWPALQQSVQAFGFFYELAGLFHEGLALFSHTNQQIQSLTEPAQVAPQTLLGFTLIWQGHFLHRQGLVEEAATAVDQAQQIATKLNLPDLQMRALTSLAAIKSLQGSYQLAQTYLQETITYYEEKEEKQALADVYGSMGHLFWRRGQYNQAIIYLEKGLKLQRTLNNVVGQAKQINILGLVYRQQGDLSKSDDCFRQALVINQALGYQDGISKNLTNRSIVLRQQGKFKQALVVNLEAEAVFQKLGHKEGIALLAGNRGIIHQSMGNMPQAAACFELALQLDETLGNQAGIARHLSNSGYYYQFQHDYEQALACYNRAIPILRALDSAYFLSTPLLHKAELLLQRSDYQMAHTHALEGLHLAQQAKRADNSALGHIILAQIDFAQGKKQLAIQRLQEQLTQNDTLELQAAFHYELWRMGAGEGHALEALAMYQKIYNRMPDHAYKARLLVLKTDAIFQPVNGRCQNYSNNTSGA